MLLTRLGKKSFRLISYFEAEVEIDDSTFQTSIFVIDDKSDLIIGTDIIQQGLSVISGNDVKINKCFLSKCYKYKWITCKFEI